MSNSSGVLEKAAIRFYELLPLVMFVGVAVGGVTLLRNALKPPPLVDISEDFAVCVQTGAQTNSFVVRDVATGQELYAMRDGRFHDKIGADGTLQGRTISGNVFPVAAEKDYGRVMTVDLQARTCTIRSKGHVYALK